MSKILTKIFKTIDCDYKDCKYRTCNCCYSCYRNKSLNVNDYYRKKIQSEEYDEETIIKAQEFYDKLIDKLENKKLNKDTVKDDCDNIIKAIGGTNNIESMSLNISRLVIKIKCCDEINKDETRKLHTNMIIRHNNEIHFVLASKAVECYEYIKNLM